ncbi:hypothetical protein SELMODRAFT_266601 [Selaginella moellendorffii]|uniref:Calcium-transporting ATPase n=1 Tax=Selaginella moellendorffii TaxID=88036 RepID=D8QTC3_SELML|nr:calcium-transporting ATPase 2, plasma membrane-type [Selaginella moellendorffii]EFJ37088.1 hypothetical protein SELMODRAFT_266601 [Selaginella moellendorffii]|eukprot:XP_002961828.1 calcium-transporting ATPase 2, plasma membrane-type [Selaginella moellendorffii]
MESRRGSDLGRGGSKNTFEIPHKDTPLEVLESWRKATLVLNASRRFRYTANVKKRRDADEKRRKFKTTGQVVRAAFRFIDAGISAPDVTTVEDEKAKQHGFQVSPKQLSSLGDRSAQESTLKSMGGIHGVAQKLLVSLDDGVSKDEIDKRKEAFGSNMYEEKPPKGFWVFVWEAMHDLTLAILGFCAILSLVIGVLTEGWKEGWYDGTGIALSIILVVFVTAASDYQQSLQFRDLDKEKKNILVQVTRNHKRQKVSIFDLVVGDVVHLSIGDQVPADGLFISGYSLVIDESSMTGESEPQHVGKNKPFLLSGTKVQDGSALMLVTGVGMNTEWGHLMAVLGEGGDDETPLQVRLNGVATLIGKIGLGFAVVTFLVLLLRFLIKKRFQLVTHDALEIVNFFAIAVTIIVVAVPEGLPLAVTLTLAYAMKKMMRDKALVRHLSACETMGSATCICSDKTGTLTTNHMTVVKSWIGGRVWSESRPEVCAELHELVLENCFQNTSGDVGDGEGGKPDLIGTPTETAVLSFGISLGGNFKDVRSQSSILKVEPFNSAKKRMGVLVKGGHGTIRAHWKGASEIVLGMCDKYLDTEGNVCPIDEKKYRELKGIITTFADEALRTLCMAFRELESEPAEDKLPDNGFTCIGIVGIKDPVRPGVREAVQLCFAAGIKVRMVTGDNINTAVAIARECGILTDGEAIEGPDFRRLSTEEMRKLIPSLQVMARSSPTDKHTLVRELRALDEVVSVTGDGTNDAPALHEADVGLAMGIAGTEVAKESADIVILDDKFNTIVVVAKWGRSVYTNIQKFVQFQLTVNLVALVLNFTSACITGTAPLTAVQLLWVNLIMDTLGALALATEPPTDDLMKRTPVGRKGSFISTVMWRNIAVQVVYQLVVLNVLLYKGKDILGYDTLTLNTLIFNVFVFCQVFNELNARDMEKLNVFKHTFNNITFLLVILFTVVFQTILVEFLGKLADTTPLNAKQWGISVLLGAIGVPLAMLGKLIPVPAESSCFSSHSSDNDEEDNDGYQPLPQSA